MRTKNSVYYLLIRLISTFVPSLLSVILNNLILTKYGSDTNGLIATISQILSLLTVFEGGFTLATIVALYKPYLNQDFDKVNSIISTTKKIYTKVGYVVVFFSITISFLLPYFIKSGIDVNTIRILFLISSSNLAFQFFVYSKYTIMFSVAHKDYIHQSIFLLFSVLGISASIYAVYSGVNILIYSLIMVAVPFIRLPVTIFAFRKHFPQVYFNSNVKNYDIYSSSKDVLFQKITLLIFGSTDLILLSIMLSTVSSSIYAVYNMIFNFIKNILFSFILAPLNAFGQLSNEDNHSKLVTYYKMYQFVSISLSGALITTSAILALPFIALYTKNVTDVSYLNFQYVIFFSLISLFQLTSNILGGFSNVRGDFKDMKGITFIGTLINIAVSVALVKVYGINGILLGTFLGYLYMISHQIYLVHIKTLKNGSVFIIKLLLSNMVLSAILLLISLNLNLEMKNYYIFIVYGFITLFIVVVLFSSMNIMTNIKLFNKIMNIFVARLKEKKNG